MSDVVVLAAGFVVFVGAIVQGGAGLGMNLLAVPLLTLLDRDLVPVPLLFTALVQSLLVLYREHGHVDWRGVGYSVAGRVPGAVLGATAVVALSGRAFAITVGGLVLGCVVLSLIAWHPRPTAAALLTAGFVGGATGTSSSIGAPPLALLYQRSGGPTIRSTLAAYIVFGGFLSLTALAVSGQVGIAQLRASAVLLPFMAAGFMVSNRLLRFLDAGWMRTAVLGISGISAAVLITRALL